MEKRAFIFDKFNTWYDWRCTLTAKSVQAAEPKTNYINIEGAHGTLDLSEALTGEPVYNDRTVTASFMCSEGSYKDREALLRQIRTALHGRKISIIEPDDPEHYFAGRVRLTETHNYQAYMTFDIEATCDPWRYAMNETSRRVAPAGETVGVVLRNAGDKTLHPVLTVAGAVVLDFDGAPVELTTGVYTITGLKLRPGANVVNVSGSGSVVFTYREASL